jgi:hypothetical protein
MKRNKYTECRAQVRQGGLVEGPEYAVREALRNNVGGLAYTDEDQQRMV